MGFLGVLPSINWRKKSLNNNGGEKREVKRKKENVLVQKPLDMAKLRVRVVNASDLSLITYQQVLIKAYVDENYIIYI